MSWKSARATPINYLIPQGLATVATDHHKRMVEKHRAKLEAIEKSRLAGLQSVADAIARQSVTIEANANDEGHLYGSVGAVGYRQGPQGTRCHADGRSGAPGRSA